MPKYTVTVHAGAFVARRYTNIKAGSANAAASSVRGDVPESLQDYTFTAIRERFNWRVIYREYDGTGQVRLWAGFIGILMAVCASVAILSALVWFPIYYMESRACDNLHELTGNRVNMSVSNGCLIEVRGKWRTRDNYLNGMRELEVNK